MDVRRYLEIKATVADLGFADEYAWAQNLQLCLDPDEFFRAYAWVVISSGIKNETAQAIWERVSKAISEGRPVLDAFNHRAKVAAIEAVSEKRADIHQGFLAAEDRLWYLSNLPFMGPATTLHLARDLGLDAVKPDRHLIRIADAYGLSPNGLCTKLSEATGDRVGAVDVVLWRAANLGIL